MKGSIPAQHAARMKAIAANVKVAWPHDGTQRDKGSGDQLAEIYKREGCKCFRNTRPYRGGYSTEAGVMEILVRMRSDRLQGCRWLPGMAGRISRLSSQGRPDRPNER